MKGYMAWKKATINETFQNIAEYTMNKAKCG